MELSWDFYYRSAYLRQAALVPTGLLPDDSQETCSKQEMKAFVYIVNNERESTNSPLVGCLPVVLCLRAVSLGTVP